MNGCGYAPGKEVNPGNMIEPQTAFAAPTTIHEEK
jgi:hypothetical protein